MGPFFIYTIKKKKSEKKFFRVARKFFYNWEEILFIAAKTFFYGCEKFFFTILSIFFVIKESQRAAYLHENFYL